MKKTSFFKIMATMVAVAMLAACSKDGGNKKDDDDDDDDPITTSEIAIDGSFADWNTATGVITGKGYNAIKDVKYYTADGNLYFYVKIDKAFAGVSPKAGAAGANEVRFYIDTDNSVDTGLDMAYNFPDSESAQLANGIDNLVILDYSNAETGALTNPIGVVSGEYAFCNVNPELDPDWFSPMKNTQGVTGDAITECINGKGAFSGEFYEVEMVWVMETFPFTLPAKLSFVVGAVQDWETVGYSDMFSWTWK